MMVSLRDIFQIVSEGNTTTVNCQLSIVNFSTLRIGFTMAKTTLSTPAPRQDETIVGFGWFAFQLLLLPSLLTAGNGLLKRPLSGAEINFIYFLLNFLAMLWILHRFLREAWKPVKAHPILFLQAVVLGLAAYWASYLALSWAIGKLDPSFVNRNDASISAMRQEGYGLMLVGTVLLSPLAEECMYRGLVFRNLYKTSPIAAYLISMAAFSAVHIVSFLGSYTPLQLVLAFLQYLPAGLWLAWCYTKSGTVYGPIAMHMLINAYSFRLLR